MADYQELLHRAISQLPSNSGAARRAVYEKARAALVAQLKGISPPLPSQQITQYRLQLEENIVAVERLENERVLRELHELNQRHAKAADFDAEEIKAGPHDPPATD